MKMNKYSKKNLDPITKLQNNIPKKRHTKSVASELEKSLS